MVLSHSSRYEWHKPPPPQRPNTMARIGYTKTNEDGGCFLCCLLQQPFCSEPFHLLETRGNIDGMASAGLLDKSFTVLHSLLRFVRDRQRKLDFISIDHLKRDVLSFFPSNGPSCILDLTWIIFLSYLNDRPVSSRWLRYGSAGHQRDLICYIQL